MPAWAPLVPAVAAAVKAVAERVEAYPTPRLTSVSVGDRRVRGDASTYLALFAVKGPFAVPGPRPELDWIRFESPVPSPWTATPLAFYPQDGVLLTGSTYVKLMAAMTADLVAARPLCDAPGGGTHVPWISIGVGRRGRPDPARPRPPARVGTGGRARTLKACWSASSRPFSSSTS